MAEQGHVVLASRHLLLIELKADRPRFNSSAREGATLSTATTSMRCAIREYRALDRSRIEVKDDKYLVNTEQLAVRSAFAKKPRSQDQTRGEFIVHSSADGLRPNTHNHNHLHQSSRSAPPVLEGPFRPVVKACRLGNAALTQV